MSQGPDPRKERSESHPAGRWPANVIHDGSEEVLAEFARFGKHKAGGDHSGCEPSSRSKNVFGALPRVPLHKSKNVDWRLQETSNFRTHGDTGSAARFFYCAKASPEARNRGCEGIEKGPPPASGRSKPAEGRQSALGKPRSNSHPTVKPLALMCYLVRLVTPPGGVVLDPFMGSGSTLVAAAKEGFEAVGIELEAENCEITARRCRGHLGMLVEIEHG